MDRLATSLLRSMIVFGLSLTVYSLGMEMFRVKDCYTYISESERLKDNLYHNTYLCYRSKLKGAKTYFGGIHE